MKTVAKGRITIDQEMCKGCGFCSAFCPKDCIHMGGTAILSDEPIYSSLICHSNALIVMKQTSLQVFSERIEPGSLLTLDSSLIKEWTDRENVETVKIPATDQTARLGSSQSANLLLLGVHLQKAGAPGLNLVEKALQERMTQENKEYFLPKNLEALRWGYQHFE